MVMIPEEIPSQHESREHDPNWYYHNLLPLKLFLFLSFLSNTHIVHIQRSERKLDDQKSFKWNRQHKPASENTRNFENRLVLIANIKDSSRVLPNGRRREPVAQCSKIGFRVEVEESEGRRMGEEVKRSEVVRDHHEEDEHVAESKTRKQMVRPERF